MPIMASSDKHAWWSELRHSGMVISPALLEEKFPAGPVEPKWYSYQRLRERYTTFETWLKSEKAYEQGTNFKPLYDWLDGVLEIFLGHAGGRWEQGSGVAARWKYDTLQQVRLAPDRVLFRDHPHHNEPALFVCIDKTPHLGMGKGRMAYGRLLELLRAKNIKLGLLTNGKQFRLCYAGLDYDSWVEWDVESWFAEGELRRQLYGFYTLLGPEGLNARDGQATSFPLLDAAEASRSRQGDLSVVLGEQVREAIELLLHELNNVMREKPDLFAVVRHTPQGAELSQRRVLEALYQAAVRIIMRLVIVFFAEARDMLPLSLPIYHASYGLEGLYEQLRRAAQYEGRKALEERESAWARLLSLFSLIYYGSTMHILPVQSYGGLLFRPGDETSPDATLRAIALFESLEAITITDATVLHLLELLKNGKLKIKQGRSSRWVKGPVDFSELRTEYIGLMYQGLLDFNLHMTEQPMIFLNLGQEPVLPLKQLEEMSEPRLKDLLKKLKTEKGSSTLASEEEAGEDGENGEENSEASLFADEELADEVEEEEIAESETDEEESATSGTLSAEEQLRQRAQNWAEKAVEIAGLLKKPKGKQQAISQQYAKDRAKQGKSLLKRTLAAREFYLIRRGGTRKGSGTFYTRPQLSVPITWRTLELLAYIIAEDGTKLPRTPEEILSIKVCDPACGSASFLVAALHYLTDALYAALVYHRRITTMPKEDSTRVIVTLPLGTSSHALPEEEILPGRPDNENFMPRTKARLRRYVVERCIYGVDLSPLAVELARMSLWIETMDRNMPFTFLDHKIKVGNSLVGAWFDTFREYPIMAWMREGGDTSHTNGVHYQQEEWTKAIKQERNDVIKPELIVQIESSGPQLILFDEARQLTPESVHREITFEMEQLHAMPVEFAQEREERYQTMLRRTSYQEIKQAFDSWCAIWFWPADKLDIVPTPANFYRLPPATQALVAELAADLRFFHWELEFPDVFARPAHGFDTILANPPWEISKPYSQEFFSEYDPLYRTHSKQDAIREQNDLFQFNPAIEREWLLYQANFKGMSNWIKKLFSPFGDPDVQNADSFTLKAGNKGEQLHTNWRKRRSQYISYADSDHPFRYQGSTGAGLNTYKMFLEVAYHLLAKGGYLGMLVPSGIYTDQGSTALRSLFLNHCKWHWLFGFINWQRIFDIDSRFKFVVIVLEKGRKTELLPVAFNQIDLAELEHPENHLLAFSHAHIIRFSPKSLAIVEPQTQKDLIILEKCYQNSVFFNDQSQIGWQIKYTNEEFNMTRDSKLFPPLPKWQEKSYQPDGYGHWIDQNGGIAFPLYEGRMIGLFDPSKKGWVSGKGRSAVWRDIPADNKVIEPQYLMSLQSFHDQENSAKGNKIAFMRISSATNARSMYSCIINNLPCGNSLSMLEISPNCLPDLIALEAILNSFTYDYALRCRLGGINLNYFIIAETPLIPPSRIRPTICARLAARLNLIMPSFAPQWLEMRVAYPELGELHWRKQWAITEHERLRLRCILDAIVAELYGLDYDDFAWILRNDPNNPKGFQRVDKNKPVELRHTTLALAAFKRLKEVGLEAFSQEDWQFPAHIAAQFGPRFTEWQEEGTIAESWAECESHAQRMQAILPAETVQPIPIDRVNENGNGKNGKQNKNTNLAQIDNARQHSLWAPEHE